MPHRHLTLEALEQVAAGELEAKDLVRSLLDHLLAVCPHCRGAWHEVILPRVPRSSARGQRDYGSAFERALRSAAERGPDLEAERAAAPGLVAELVQASEAEQVLLLSSEERLLTWGVCDLLIRESHQAAFEDPGVAESLANLAISLASRLSPAVYGRAFLCDVKAIAWAYLGNARRVRSDLKGAAQALVTAEEYLADGVGDPLSEAQILNLRASLLRDQRQFDESQLVLERVLSIYRLAGDTQLEGRTLIKKAMAYSDSGKPAGAIPLLRRALDLLDQTIDPRAVLCAQHNLVICLMDSGHLPEATAVFAATLPLYEHFPEFSTSQLHDWIHAKLAAAHGRTLEAEAIYEAVRQRFLERGIGYDAAVVSLELSALYLRRGMTGEVKRLAEEMYAVFQSRDVHREAMAALLVFQRAALADAATLQMVEQLTAYLRRARRDPSLRFEEPS